MGVDDLNALGHEKKRLLAVIRDKCYDCCCYQLTEVRKCTAVDCPLRPRERPSRPLYLDEEHAPV